MQIRWLQRRWVRRRHRRRTMFWRWERSFADPYIVQIPLAVAPILDDFDKEFEEHLFADQFFDVSSCLCADVLDAGAAFADDDLFLRRPLDIDRTKNSRHCGRAFVKNLGH